MDMAASASRRLLAVTAHPDDETFIMGGTLARYAAEGASVHLLVASKDTGNLGIVREAELKCAARELGLTGFAFLDYVPTERMTWRPPGADVIRYLVSSPLEEVGARIRDEMRRLRPQVVVTFDPTGAYGHPDHIRAGEATRWAFERLREEDASHAPQKLYLAIFGRTLMRLGVGALWLAPGRDPRRFGPARDIDLVQALRESPRPTSYIEVGPHLERRRRAVSCHRSQLAGAPWALRRYETLPPRIRGAVFRREVYARVWPPPGRGLREEDLFEGLRNG